MKRSIVALISLSLCLVPLAASAGKRPGGGPMMKHVLKVKVGLNDQQIAKIEQLHFASDKNKLDIKYKIQSLRLEMKQEMSADKPSRSKIFGLVEKVGVQEVKLKKNRLGLLLDIRALVTSEQWQKMEMLNAQRKMRDKNGKMGKRGKRGQRGGMGGPGGPGPDMDDFGPDHRM